MSKFETKPITDASTQVPDGYCRFEDLTSDATEQKRLSDAHKAGKIPAVKLMRTLTDEKGPVWVHRDLAIEFLRGRKEQPANAVSDEGIKDDSGVSAEDVLKHVVGALCGINNSTSEMLDVLTRLTKACEGMAVAWGAKQAAESLSHSVEVCGDEITVFHN